MKKRSFIIMLCCVVFFLSYTHALVATDTILPETVIDNTSNEDLFVNFLQVKISPIVTDLLNRDHTLLYGGGKVFQEKAGWIGIGIGYSHIISTGDTATMQSARKIARVNATTALSSFINGIHVNVDEEQKIKHTNRLYEEWITKNIREEMIGELRSIQVAGEWITAENEIAVAVVIAHPSLNPLLTAPKEHLKITFKNTNIEQKWLDIIKHYPWIFSGGVSVCTYDDNLYILAIEKGQTQGSPTYDTIQLPIIMDAHARRAIAQYVEGLKSKNVTTYQETIHLDLSKAQIYEQLNSITYENIEGVISKVKLLGKWYSDDEKTLFQAFVVPLPHKK